MPSITIVVSDTSTGGISVRSDYHPTAGSPCSRAQSAALDMVRRTRKEFGLSDPSSTALAPVPLRTDGVDIDRVHRTRDNVVNVTGAADFLPTTTGNRRFFPVQP